MNPPRTEMKSRYVHLPPLTLPTKLSHARFSGCTVEYPSFAPHADIWVGVGWGGVQAGVLWYRG
jgi:hypothetical protein